MKTFLFPHFFKTQATIRDSVGTFMWQRSLDALDADAWDFSIKNIEVPVENAVLRTVMNDVMQLMFEMNDE